MTHQTKESPAVQTGENTLLKSGKNRAIIAYIDCMKALFEAVDDCATLRPIKVSAAAKRPHSGAYRGYNESKCVETRVHSGNRNRHSCGFFTSIGFTQWAGGFTGNCKAHGYVRVSNTRPPSTLRNVGRGIYQSHIGVTP